MPLSSTCWGLQYQGCMKKKEQETCGQEAKFFCQLYPEQSVEFEKVSLPINQSVFTYEMRAELVTFVIFSNSDKLSF